MTFWVLRLIAANVVMFVVSMLMPNIVPFLLLVPHDIFVRPWTLISYMFLHDGIWHLFFNMLGLYFFGPRVEMEIGSKHFFWLYMVSGLMGAALSFVFTPYTAIVGASGAIFGILYAFAHFWPREPIYLWGVLPIEARWMVVGMTALSLFGGFGGGQSNIAHFAHLGGFAGGFFYIRWMRKIPPRGETIGRIIQAPPSTTDMKRWAKIPRERLHEVNRDEYDRIMVKLKAGGAESLTTTERAFLDRFSTEE